MRTAFFLATASLRPLRASPSGQLRGGTSARFLGYPCVACLPSLGSPPATLSSVQITAAKMVSIRRRKLLGLCAGKSATLQHSACNENATVSGGHNQNIKPDSVCSLPSFNCDEQKQVVTPAAYPLSFENNLCVSTSSKEDPEIQQYPVPEVKRRKKHRRKHVEDQEPCTMRGVYFKNTKWQAAIKVDKKQIHLGTCGSQEEAARLYDRAAFMCGREPNSELSEAEKQELKRFKWEEFLAITRNAITSKKHQRRLGSGPQRKSVTQLKGGWEPEQDMQVSSASDDIDGDKSFL